jgi:hypothetical protein
MSCVLRASGKHFDVDAFLVDCKLEPLGIWRKGERRSQGAKPNEASGVRFEVSAAEFSNLAAQVKDALAFLQLHRAWVAKLVGFPGIESVIADFGAETKPPHWTSFAFEPSLLAALGAAGISLELSTYPVIEEEARNA